MSKKRNRLGDERCKDLVYVFTIQRLFDSKWRRLNPINWIDNKVDDDIESDEDSSSESVDDVIDSNFVPHIVN